MFTLFSYSILFIYTQNYTTKHLQSAPLCNFLILHNDYENVLNTILRITKHCKLLIKNYFNSLLLKKFIIPYV